MWPFTSSSWEDISRAKRAHRSELLSGIPPIDEAQEEYTKATAGEIVEHIRNGQWTASAVLEAYISRAALAQELTNCLTEVILDEARKEAESLDQFYDEHKKVVGPLHGVPISFKDLYHIKGYDSTLGFTKFSSQPADEDAAVVTAVRRAGGIPFVKTNVPQTMFFFECINPLWGRTLNPWSAQHTCGGSSGGEAALLAMDGAALGWGSDNGGSLRIPTSYCGIYSLKPGYGRIPTDGTLTNFPGLHDIPGVLGPMARCVADIEIACRLVFGTDSSNYDPAPIPYQDITLPEKLKFGYYLQDGIIQTSPVCKRAVLETVEALTRAGHECTEIVLPNAVETISDYVALTSADGTKTLLGPIGNDPKVFELYGVTTAGLYGWVRSILKWSIKAVFGDKLFPDAVDLMTPKSAHEYWKHADNVKKLISDFNKQVWEKHQFDGLIAPVQAVPAIPHGSTAYVAGLACSTTQYNVIDSPVGTVPVTRVNPDLDALTDEYNAANAEGQGSSYIGYWLYRSKNPVYDVKKMAGLPVGVQIVGRKWEEEKVVEMMKVVDGVLGPRGFGPGSWSETDFKGNET